MTDAIDYSVFESQYEDLRRALGRLGRSARIATLGPSGTTSEQALLTFVARLSDDGARRPDVRLYDDFSSAYRALLAGEVDYTLVPNAYEGVTELYWDPRLRVCCSYYRPTPSYGLYRRRDAGELKSKLNVASCPAVFSLLEHLKADCATDGAEQQIVTVSSTEKAARLVSEGGADLAITNETSAAKYGLVAASSVFNVQMLWTLFGRSAASNEAAVVKLPRASEGSPRREASVVETDVAILGAGPYGLSVAAWLGDRKIRYRVLGQPLTLWSKMPSERSLRSHIDLSCPSTPRGNRMIHDFAERHGCKRGRESPCFTTREFCAFMDEYVAAHDIALMGADAVELDLSRQGFRVTLSDGRQLEARAAVVASGLTGAAYVPAPLAGAPGVVHSSAFQPDARLAGKSVLVIGAGQAAAEAALDCHAFGARATLAARSEALSFREIHRAVTPERAEFMDTLRHRFAGWSIERRREMRRTLLPPSIETDLEQPLRARTRIVTGVSVERIESEGERARVWFSNGEQGVFDQVVAATGYRPSLSTLPFALSHAIKSNMRVLDQFPALGSHGESSVPGLFFVGALSALRFGPQSNFVFGTDEIVPKAVEAIHESLVAGGKASDSPLTLTG